MPETDEMRIAIRLDPDRLMRWQAHVVNILAADRSHSVGISVGRAPDWPRGATALFRLEHTLFGRPADDPLAPVEWPVAGVPIGLDSPDLLLDLAGNSAVGTIPVIRLLADGQALEIGALSAVLEKRIPAIQAVLIDGIAHHVLRKAWPASENPRLASAAFGMILGRAAELAIQGVREIDNRTAEQPAVGSVETRDAGVSPAHFFVEALATRIDARIRRLLGRAPNWSVAIRQQATAGLPDLSAQGFTRLADDGRRFYADPFVWETAGRRFLFVEELPFATAKGIISMAEIDRNGQPGPPRPVLETDCHLSYPFLFAHDGATWMIPETSARRTVELYRADPFPDRWTLHSVLVDGQDLGDVTLHRIDGTWWMFAASRARWTSSWDALSLFHAPGPFGPWTPHPGNPVLVDVRSARPAGDILTIGGRLVRPVQDSAEGYGSALGFASIDIISPEAYRQTLIARVAPWRPQSGLHTYNRSASLEAIDLYGPRR